MGWANDNSAPDFDEAFGAAATGAGIGTSILPGIGTAIGAGAGLLGDLIFGGKKKVKPYVDPNRGMIDSQIYRLMSSHLAQDFSNRARSRAGRTTRLALDSIGNKPGMTNASVLSDLTDNAMRAGEGNVIDADIAGAQLDEQNRARATGMLQNQSAQDFQISNYNRELEERPNALQTIGLNSLASSAGSGQSPFSAIGNMFPGDTPSLGTVPGSVQQGFFKSPQRGGSGRVPSPLGIMQSGGSAQGTTGLLDTLKNLGIL